MTKTYLDNDYVFDTPVFRNDDYRWCHLTARNIELLHQLAKTIGLDIRHFSKTPIPHYDISSKIIRRKAISKGAVEINKIEFMLYVKHHYGV